jgi:hypothetical protein
MDDNAKIELIKFILTSDAGYKQKTNVALQMLRDIDDIVFGRNEKRIAQLQSIQKGVG